VARVSLLLVSLSKPLNVAVELVDGGRSGVEVISMLFLNLLPFSQMSSMRNHGYQQRRNGVFWQFDANLWFFEPVITQVYLWPASLAEQTMAYLIHTPNFSDTPEFEYKHLDCGGGMDCQLMYIIC